jgi:hypothetical protein
MWLEAGRLENWKSFGRRKHRQTVLIVDPKLSTQNGPRQNNKRTMECRELSGCSSLVTVMKPPDLRQSNYCAGFWGLNRFVLGSIFVQRQMGARMLVIVEVGTQDASQRGIVQHNDVVQALSPD